MADLRERLRWVTPRQMSEVRTLVVAHQALRQGVSESLASLFVQCGETRDRPTRQDEQLRLPRPRTEAGKRRFGYRAPSLSRGVQKVRGPTTKEQRYELDTLDQKCSFVHVNTVQAHTFLTALHQSLQVLFEGMGFEPIQHVQDAYYRLLVVGENAIAQPFLRVREEVVVGGS